jgi:histidinol-phosphatase
MSAATRNPLDRNPGDPKPGPNAGPHPGGRNPLSRDDAAFRNLNDDLRLAHLLADDADSITMSRFKALDLHVTSKPDLTPVTDADTNVEEVIRRTLGRARPRDAVHGEEMPDTGWGPRRWVIDPIDGTKNFVRGVPVWATLISLMINDEVAVGLVSAPALGRRWWASLGAGAYVGKSLMSASPCRVSDIARIEDASLSYSSVGGWVEAGLGQPFVDLLRTCWRTRAYGDFWSYMLLAEGAVDLACEPELALHDMAACSIVVTEAGGSFTDLDGVPGPNGAGAYASNGRLHDDLLRRLRDEDVPDDPGGFAG